MKKITILLALILAPMLANAQSFFDKLEDMNGVDAIIVNKDAFEILSKFNPGKSEGNEAMEVFKMIQELKEFKVFSTNDVSIANTMDEMVKSQVKSASLTELMRIKEDDSRVKIYVKTTRNKDFVSEVLMFVKGIDKKTKGNSEAVVVSLTGNIDINKMSELADTFVDEKK
ncbi:DUF4252 domain-containing protein [Polaribacter sargassicola]|uniref:DUF4252 domain-containing protein n=1 Tax=Polaribacter sargassicola TaxID=2836891 RepID=UPI001F3AEF82|nr:DUF4252 domain-containing protein [Polaribacter sp. DS7-9]MCG1036865.1 DUF4252 domain-containing protein [Polaribacter sp. DS7-9]